jgi:hypothetical protein
MVDMASHARFSVAGHVTPGTFVNVPPRSESAVTYE